MSDAGYLCAQGPSHLHALPCSTESSGLHCPGFLPSWLSGSASGWLCGKMGGWDSTEVRVALPISLPALACYIWLQLHPRYNSYSLGSDKCFFSLSQQALETGRVVLASQYRQSLGVLPYLVCYLIQYRNSVNSPFTKAFSFEPSGMTQETLKSKNCFCLFVSELLCCG